MITKDSYILTNTLENAYTIRTRKDDSYEGDTQSKIIYVKTRRHIELLLLILEKKVSVYYDDISHSDDLFEWLNEKTYEQILSDIDFLYDEEMNIFKLIGRIGLPKSTMQSTTKINKKIVHKLDEGNVLISEGISYGKMIVFSVLFSTNEIIMDHKTDDHVEGILLFEIARQASMASIHINSSNETGIFVTLKSYMEYSKFVRDSKPCFIQTICVGKEHGLGFCVFNIIQNGYSCVKGYFMGYSYRNKDVYLDTRKSDL